MICRHHNAPNGTTNTGILPHPPQNNNPGVRPVAATIPVLCVPGHPPLLFYAIFLYDEIAWEDNQV